jgi:single-strand selective monofunctional uracil DNA glycosylase
MDLVSISATLRDAVDALHFAAPTTHVYNPLRYAWEPHAHYLQRYGVGHHDIVFIGMNPGPFGMAQTGVPFGEVSIVRDWLKIDGEVGKPANENKARPVTGLACKRSEVSGARLWGWARDTFGTPEAFFAHYFIINYCPLVFMEESGKNRTPDKLPVAEAAPLFAACDRALRDAVTTIQASMVVGVGGFAFERIRAVFGGTGLRMGRILHPSPASPLANRGWAAIATRELREMGALAAS